MEDNKDRYLYVMLSRTNTKVANWIQRNTACKYTHASISLNRDLSEMYSFARRRPHNFMVSGFIHENLDAGVYSWNPTAQCILYRIAVTEETYERVNAMIDTFMSNYKKHTYNMIGLVAIKHNKVLERKYKYACSQFVAHVLLESGAVKEWNKSIWLMSPDDLIDFPGSEEIYKGELQHVRDEK